jgi:hypothetical protein
MIAVRVVTLFLGVSTVAGCFLSPLPDLKTPADRAHALDTKCRGFSDNGALSLLPQGAVDSVEPAYSYVQSGPMAPEARMRGARIHVRPMPGMSRESLTRMLECHEARAVLGGAPLPDADPFALPLRWLDIDVDSEGDGFVVQVRTDDFVAARKVLERAKSYAAATRSGQPLPPPASTGLLPPSSPASTTVRANAHASAFDGSALQID